MFAMDRAGLVGDDGPTHHGFIDVSYFRCLPNVVVMAPRDEAMLVHMLRTALAHDGPIAFRYPRGAAEGVPMPDAPQEIQIGKGELLLPGERVALLGGGHPIRQGWLEALMLEAGSGAPTPDGPLDRLFVASRTQLADPDLGFGLLLPDDERPVAERAEALLGWCRGFLGGFGLSAGEKPPLSDEAREALDDLSKIAASRLAYDDPDGDEAAFVEVAEFVRVAALLLYSDCVGAAPASRLLH